MTKTASNRAVESRVIEEVSLIIQEQAPSLRSEDVQGVINRMTEVLKQQGWATDVDLIVLHTLNQIAGFTRSHTIH